MSKENQNSFTKKHPVIKHLLLMICAIVVLIYGALYLIDIFTEHGSYKEVPEIKNMPIRQAISTLENAGFKWEITDSVYNDKLKPGVVTEQTPKGKSKIKSNRTIYIGINAMTPRSVTFPFISEVSERQGQAILEGLGFRNITVETVPSPFKGLIILAKMNGLTLRAGQKLPISSHITLVIGDGNDIINEVDSVTEIEGAEFGTDGVENTGSDIGVDFMQ